MKIIKVLLTLIILLCNLSFAQAKDDYRLEYLNLVWWQKYNDENLLNYLTDAFRNNQDLKIASLNVKQSEQIVKQAFANQLPSLSFDGELTRTLAASDVRFGEVLIKDYSQSHFTLPLTMTYEADIWGENYLKTKSMKKNVEIAKQNERTVYIGLTTAIASQYFNLIKLDKIVDNYKKLIDIQTDIVKMEDIKFNNGMCPITEHINEKQILSMFQKILNNYENERQIVARQLLVLTGMQEKDLELIIRNNYENVSVVPLPQSINAEVIKFRPDLLKTEAYIEKIGIDVKVARRDFLPKFLIYGNVGFNAYQLGNIFGNHTFLSNIGVLPSLDLFTGGAKMARLRYKKLELEKAQQIYEKTILTSIQEINDSMSTANKNNQNYLESLKRFNLEKEKFELSDKKFEIGAKSKLDNLKAKQILLTVENDKITSEIDYLVSAISVYKAIGGKDYTNINDNL